MKVDAKKPRAICAECEHHKKQIRTALGVGGIGSYPYRIDSCWAKAHVKRHCISGEQSQHGVRKCRKVNKHGNCPDFVAKAAEGQTPPAQQTR